MASRVRPPKAFKRVMKGLPGAMRQQLVGVLDRGGRALLAIVRARAPSKTGALRRGISYRVYEKTLRLRIGLLGTPRGRARLFYGRIQDLGRKAKIVTVQRRARLNGHLRTSPTTGRKINIASTYRMRVPRMAPKRFISGRYPDLRNQIGSGLRGIWDRALKTIAGGGARD